MKTPQRLTSWIAAVAVTLVLAGYFTWRLLGEDRLLFTPGAMTHGHYQIELACDACHTPFAGVKQQTCLDCHGARLAASDDSHPKKKFEDPRNADRLEVLNALRCVTCHLEHRPQQTRAMGVTLPDDFCAHCHQEVGDDRPSHENLAFDTCAAAGCHNFHDNTALYEDFLAKHAHEPATAARPAVPLRDLGTLLLASGAVIGKTLGPADQDAPAEHADTQALHEWATTAHARAGVNCRDCHQPKETVGWIEKPAQEACTGCHEEEVNGFLDGKHGMRLRQKLPPMSPTLARLPMRADVRDRVLGCTSCHGAHAFDTRTAAAGACLECHNDEHSRAYEGSPHHRLWLAEQAGKAAAGRGVSCATCHLPRHVHKQGDVTGVRSEHKFAGSEFGQRSEATLARAVGEGETQVRVEHNQNWNLRPNEKMAKGVCLHCHGLPFTLDALADPRLVANNFRGRPARHVESVDWAARRVSSSPKPRSRP